MLHFLVYGKYLTPLRIVGNGYTTPKTTFLETLLSSFKSHWCHVCGLLLLLPNEAGTIAQAIVL